MKPVVVLYLVGTFCASLTAVAMSFIFPTTLSLVTDAATNSAPEGIMEVLHTLLFKIIDNPINALMTGNFIGILGWAIALGLGLHSASDATKKVFIDLSNCISSIVTVVIQRREPSFLNAHMHLHIAFCTCNGVLNDTYHHFKLI